MLVLLGYLLVIQILALVAQQIHLLLRLVGLKGLLFPHILNSFLQHLVFYWLFDSTKLRILHYFNLFFKLRFFLNRLKTLKYHRACKVSSWELVSITLMSLSWFHMSAIFAPRFLFVKKVYAKEQDLLPELFNYLFSVYLVKLVLQGNTSFN